ncbi:MAG: DNA methyltransferase [Gaiellaceae bacterium]
MFERHIPEIAVLGNVPIEVGALVVRRQDQDEPFRVQSITGKKAIVVPANGAGGDAEQDVPLSDLMIVKGFREPLFPALTALESDRIERSETKPYHAVVNGENYHVLQLLSFALEGQVDCIYIDPPYNSGATDWKYNNRYVDANDRWRHSKWLSMMDKRLRLARRMLRPDGVLIVTIDENEVHHLGMLLEQVMDGHLLYTVTIVINPKGTFKINFGRVDEYAVFCVPDTGEELIAGKPLTAGSEVLSDLDADLEHAEGEEPDEDAPPEFSVDAREYEDLYLRRRGAESSFRYQRPNQFYAIYVDEKKRRVVGIGPLLGPNDPYKVTRSKGVLSIYPIDGEGNERVWRYVRETMERYIADGAIVVGRKTGDTYALNHRRPRNPVRRLKTVWWDRAHDAGVHGTNVLTRLLGRPNAFPFPKSIYAVKDCLAAVCRNRPDALIVDFFAGSGTTLHSTALLNAEDGGSRRCILVTNNEVEPRVERRLKRAGYYPGDKQFEAEGIFESVTRPRVRAAITGVRPDGQKLPGTYRGGRAFADGFDENVEFYRLDYLDPDDVELGRSFDRLRPVLWLAAGALGPQHGDPAKPLSLVDGSPYAILFDEAHLRAFVNALRERPDVSHVYFVTDSEEAYAEMAALVGLERKTYMLHRDYLRHFRVKLAHAKAS